MIINQIEMDAYRARVRIALVGQRDRTLDLETLNDLLHHLGLSRIESRWAVRISWRGEPLPEATVMAEDADHACGKVLEALRIADIPVSMTMRGGLPDTADVTFDWSRVDITQDCSMFIEDDDFELSATPTSN
jgi:hypothetical protein